MTETFLQKHSQNVMLATIIASAFSVIVTLGNAGFTIYATSASQDRQVRIEQLSKFDSASQALLEAAGVFITAVNTNNVKDIDAARLKVRTVVATQIQDTEVLKKTFNGKVASLVDGYQGALAEFNRNAQQTASVTDMRPWAESFGRVLDSRTALSQALSVSLGLAENKR
jgi:hypothetical protein